jgi:hypothetical protein
LIQGNLLLLVTGCHLDPVQFLFDSMKGVIPIQHRIEQRRQLFARLAFGASERSYFTMLKKSPRRSLELNPNETSEGDALSSSSANVFRGMNAIPLSRNAIPSQRLGSDLSSEPSPNRVPSGPRQNSSIFLRVERWPS